MAISYHIDSSPISRINLQRLRFLLYFQKNLQQDHLFIKPSLFVKLKSNFTSKGKEVKLHLIKAINKNYKGKTLNE